jgi:UDP-N-acetyl-D-glucosamine dehydrogenase
LRGNLVTTPHSPTGLAEQLMDRIRARKARVAVIGLGYVGLPLAEAFASAGYPVIGFDIDAEKIQKLRAGQSYIGHIPSARVAELVAGGLFNPTADPRELAAADAVIICVPTPLTETREPDLSYITGTGTMIAKQLRRGQLVVLESTTYPGTTDDVLRPILEASGLRAGADFFLAFSPEREDPGNQNFSTRNIPKVVGGMDEASGRLAVALYEPVVGRVVPVANNKVAEACKILENTYRAVNIALVNELKIVFDAMGIDVWDVIEAAKTKPFGFHAFYPGPGLGGHCIPIDPFYLTSAARKYGVNTRFIELAGEVNTAMPRHVVARVAEALNEDGKPVKGSRVCVLGVAYKKDVDDTRESPALEVMELLQARGAVLSYNDPHVRTLPRTRRHAMRMDSQELTEAFLAGQDCMLVVTDHTAYDMAHVARHARLVVDTRNALRGLEGLGARIRKA